MESNKLIAEFMGVPCDKDLYTPLCPHTGETLFIPSSQMKYDTSWDWLMPVHKKCMFTPNFSGDDELRTLLIDAVIDADINRLYDAVVEFIKQYDN